jgi:hypothetical protein
VPSPQDRGLARESGVGCPLLNHLASPELARHSEPGRDNDAVGLLQHFKPAALTFSDEVGVPKPNPASSRLR